MSKTKEIFNQKIKQINEFFDKQHYLKKGRRSGASVFQMLRCKSIKYKENIESAQSELSAELAQRVEFRFHTLVACAIGARVKKFYSFGTSYRVVQSCNPRLKRRLARLGDVGKKSANTNSTNVIGKCAEVKAANQILRKSKKLDVPEIELTPAIRPRTLERIPRCPNCVVVFGPEK